MNLRTFKKLDDGVYQIKIETQDWSENDRLLMTRFSEPEIDLGGDFPGINSGGEFTLNTRLVKIMTESPFTQRFDSRDYDDADDRAESWKTEIQTRITDAILNLRALDDTFTGEEVQTI